ncbi:bifunctional alpha/beta hydrolase/class I SAM-dependent methyltransferase [bacterium]|nr:bifunctional alpha/beta hydrolase/class I SAM-dependent methyltransferase [bacterium]
MRQSSEHHFTTGDGASLFYRAWLPSTPPQRALLLFHRGHEHSARMQPLVDGLQLEDYAIFAWDQRGCGHSPGPRGHARSLAQLEQDMQAFLDHLCEQHSLQPENIVVIAHSVAAVVAGLWAVDYAPRLRGLVLATPALHIKLYVPLARPALALARRLGLMENVQSYVRGGALTHDREQARQYDQDPLISRQISSDMLLDLHQGARRLQQCAPNLDTPTLVLSSRADWVVKNLPIRRFFRALPSPYKESQVYRNFYHALFHEKDRHLVFQDVRAFVLRCFERPVDRSRLAQADRYGLSAERYRWHQAGLPWLHPKNWVMMKLRLALKSVGRISQGMRIGLRSGFSSGSSLDYVYQNQPGGFTPLGRWLDAGYLAAIGWVRVRQRRAHLMQLLGEVLQNNTTVLDVAGGPARYLIDLLAPRPDLNVRVLVRDRDPAALEEGRRLARPDARFDYAQSDALDARALAAQGPVDIAIVSGLYELIPGNGPLTHSLQGLAAAVKSGGYLIYTNQPYHPQLELIAETLTHGDGSRWVMRCRSTAEMDELVAQAGFKKVKMLIDDDGIFSVSLAQKL